MDTFIDKLAQKFTAQEIIKANMAAEAKENRKLKEQIEQYETMLQEMKQLNLKNIESAERVNKLVADGCDSLKQASEQLAENQAGDSKELEELFAKIEDALHKENVKVYRNVQAAIKESLDEQTDKLIASQKETGKKQGVFLKVTSILILITTLAGVALQVLQILGIL